MVKTSYLLGATRALRSDNSKAPASVNCRLPYSLWNSRYLPTTVAYGNNDILLLHVQLSDAPVIGANAVMWCSSILNDPQRL